jgi:multicomponent Na+:H+ antiporter subunit G
VVGALALLGSGFVLVAALGIVRLPDVFTRMHAATKPATLGVGLIIVAVAVHFGEMGVATRALLVGAFFVLTVPVGAHMIGRAAYLAGARLWEGTVVDEWRGTATRPRG